jgi:acyl-[acyl-carrier-protein] desaturase
MTKAPEIDAEKDSTLFWELSNATGDLLNHHLEVTKNWYPHEEIPFDQAKTFNEDQPWSPDEYPLEEGVRSALLVNLLTEDNLPYYSRTILNYSHPEHPLSDWGHQWTAEECRHSLVIRDWALATRALDPKQLEISRMVQMSTGEVPEPPTFAELIAYTSLQELATQIAHRNTGKALDKERMGRRVMALVAGDEKLHHEFYSGLVSSALEIDPSTMLIAINQQVRNFKMPGTGIPDFKKHTKAIAEAGIYDLDQFLNSVLKPTLDKWNIENLGHLTFLGEQALDSLEAQLKRLGHVVLIQQERHAQTILDN